MKTATVKITGISTYGQTQRHRTPKLEKESNDDYRLRTWREHAHFDKNGFAVIPQMAFKNCLDACAKYLSGSSDDSMKIPGKGKATYTKCFQSGVMVFNEIPIIANGKRIHKDNLQSLSLDLPSDGVAGSGKRVLKTYPIFPEWECTVTFQVLDESIPRDTFEHVVNEAGKFIGIGWFRPQNRGYFGRFMAEVLSWE